MEKRHKVLLAAAFLVIFCMALLIVFGDHGVTDLYQLKSRRDQLLRTNQTLALENIRLINQIDRLKTDPTYIETIARDELGLISKDEIILKPMKPAKKP